MPVYISVPTEKSDAKNFRDLEQKVKLGEFGDARGYLNGQVYFYEQGICKL